MAPIRDSVSHSSNQTGLEHAGLEPQYENSLWSSGSDSNSNWGKVIVDKGTWPSITGSDPELASECMHADSASSSVSEKNLSMMASGNTGGDNNGNRQGSNHFMVANGSNNVGNGSVKGPWGMSNGSMLSTCQGSVEGPNSKLAEGSQGKINAWGTQSSSTNGGINPSTLNPNANNGAWPVLQNTGPNPHGPVGNENGNGGTNSQQSTICQTPSMQSINSKMSWGCLQENISEAEVNGTNKVPSGQPQNINTEFNGPNNTTNTMTSSLLNCTGSMQMNEQPPGHRAWPVSTGGSPQLPISTVSNGTSISQHGNSEGINSGSYGTACGIPPGTNYSGEKCPVPKGQAVGDTVNATLMQSGANGFSVSAAPLKNNNNSGMGSRGGGWDSASTTSQSMSWRAGNSVDPAGIPRPWGSASSSSSSSSSSSNTGTKVSNGEWNTLPSNSQHSNDSTNGSRKGTNGWKSLEDDALGIGSCGQASQGSTWNKSTGSEGSGDSSGGRSDIDGQRNSNRRRGNQQGMINAALSKIDVDPRVLSNTGWGQTPVLQNTAWDVSSSDKKTGNGQAGWGSAPPQASYSGGWGDRPSTNSSDSSVSGWTEQKPSTGWGESKGPVGQGGWEEASSVTMNKGSSSWNGGKDEKSSSWNNTQKAKQGWGGPSAGEGWGGECPKGNHWEEPQKSGSGGWDSDSDRSGSGWSEPGHCGTSNTWGGSGGTNTPDQSGPTTGWGEPAKTNNQNQGWGEPIKPSHSNPTWGDATKPNNSSEWGKSQEFIMGTFRSGNTPQTGAPGQNKPTGWLGGPMPAASKESSSTGWEEPSPESIRRRMEIDDGTSAWGDPNKYNHSNVNMWNKNTAGEQDGMAASQPPQAQSSMAPKEKSCNSGWGEPYGGPQKMESSTWGEPAGPPVKVDNGTSAWGKPVDSGSSWEEPGRENSGGGGWGNAAVGQQSQHKSGSKPMQDNWCGEEMSVAGHSNWEEEEEVEIGMWNNNPSQETNQTGNWSYKKMPPKLNKGPNKQDDSLWMNQFVQKFNNIYTRDSSEDSLKSNKMDMPGGMTDKRMDVDKHVLNMGEYGKNPASRHQIHKDSSIDRNPYMDKNVNMYGVSNAAAQGRNTQQPPAQPLNSTQSSLRNQVPPPLLPSQVPPSLFKYSPNNGGLNPLFGPQQVAMLNQLTQLNQLSQLSQINQLQRLLLQQKAQNQRAMPVNSRQQQEQQGRGLGPSQQMIQPSRHLDPSLRKQQTSPQPPSLHQPSFKSYMENFMPPNASDLQKEQNSLSSFSNFPLGGCPPHLNLGQTDSMLHQAAKPNTMFASDMSGYQSAGIRQSHSLLAPPLSNGHMVPGSPINPRVGKNFCPDSSSLPARGLNSNLNVSNLDISSVGFKEPQSRLKKWTAMDISVNSPLDQNPSKSGAITSGLRLEDSPFGPYDFINASNAPISPPGSVGDGWPSRAKSPHGSTNVNWPPEFRPGEPWKGYPNIDPETDPFVTPGSVINNLSINTVRDVDHLRDRNNGPSSSLNTTLPSNSAWTSIRASNHNSSLSSTAQSTSARNSDSKWSPGIVTNTSLAHELWKVPLPSKGISAPSRLPPGLTGQKQPSSWDNSSLRLAGWGSSESRFTSGTSWGDSSSGRTNWLVLKNLTPQIDGSTLRTLCMQHGPLITFHLNLPHGNAVVCYSSKEEAAKAQKSLHMCVLGNTTILAEFASEEEINSFFAQGQSMTASPSWQTLGSSQNRIGSIEGSHPFPNRTDPNHWNVSGLSGAGSGDLHGSSLWGVPNYSTSLWGSPSTSEGGGINCPSPISSFLPVDHLTGGGESM
ncbi:trinucleotide repeat-containing gene 6A protein-like isoform X2 [Myxocyprinus asiaticus]|uniref:trinucleotide repeat-containing gene 6A protein-like isoform X2 n=1 Tax=Myxocyprinus asiaticus TaxID=70543 RepID=UPI0022221108|nr:trinucleotide repeat-containing gene 6A protein-like isoform X2 [Myxocyprinus asiaticus]